ncbi:MAG: hypothetical protein UY76_C0048G0008 [Candidatus Uhrbacteria bacterium GW2011_GWA2_52_8d]|uniref:Uncharacterized protein n=1 Tax=Candidatus Uhrbacteria bacterium GW2011_GWA2_52_8d TaxID=1618979 RepID=A0A0G1XLX4_9BACT|nr:MAG: hypothetical protein UY76_C0048G0008 [Candidatus Uhrbacteria bacterium GW2011_GWA2_52_8d]
MRSLAADQFKEDLDAMTNFFESVPHRRKNVADARKLWPKRLRNIFDGHIVEIIDCRLDVIERRW